MVVVQPRLIEKGRERKKKNKRLEAFQGVKAATSLGAND